MARRFGLTPAIQPWMLVLVFLLAQVQHSAAVFCSFWNNGCIDPLAQTAVRFDFKPLFTDPIYLYYGFDASVSGKGEGPMTKNGFWLRYQSRHINQSAIDDNHISEIAMRVGNLTGVPSGGNNGCDGIWGAECSHDIKRSLRRVMYLLALSERYYEHPLEKALEEMMMSPPSLSACPPPVLDVAAIPVQDFAIERTPEQNVTVMTSGSGENPWQVWYIDGMTAHQQASQVAIGIISRGPLYNIPPPYSPDDIQVELVCMEAPQGAQAGSDSND